MADDNDMVNVKIHDDVNNEKLNEYKEKSDDEKEIKNLGNLESSDDSDGDDDDDDDSDTAELLAGKKKSPPFWTFEYYQTFFDVDTKQVLKRIIGSMVPVRKRNFLTTQIRSNPDLYGPFWVCATLVVTIAISGNLANYLIHAGDHNWTYDFHKITFAAVAIFAYAWLVPVGIWAVLTWRGNTTGYSFLEIICVYGYSLSIFIPISVPVSKRARWQQYNMYSRVHVPPYHRCATFGNCLPVICRDIPYFVNFILVYILWVIPFELIRWIVMVIGLCLSGAVLVLTFWPAVRDDDKKVAWTILVVIFLLHASLAIGFKLYFFHSPPSVDRPISTTTPVTHTSRKPTPVVKANKKTPQNHKTITKAGLEKVSSVGTTG